MPVQFHLGFTAPHADGRDGPTGLAGAGGDASGPFAQGVHMAGQQWAGVPYPVHSIGPHVHQEPPPAPTSREREPSAARPPVREAAVPARVDSTKRREADQFSVPPIPSVVDVTTWKREVREAVAAASANPDLPSVYRWVIKAEEKLSDPDRELGFNQCPEQFRTLDSKFLQALANRVKTAGLPSLSNKHQELSDEAQERGDGVLAGRRLYYAILQHLRVSNGLELRNSLVALHGLNWPGDEHMERFSYIANEHAREAIKDGVSEDTIAGILYEKMQHSKALELPIHAFRMWAAGDPERSWRGLLRLINDRVERERNEQLRLERTAGTDKLMRGGAKAKTKVETYDRAPALSAPTAVPTHSGDDGAGVQRPQAQQQGPPNPHQVCWFHNHGGCSRGEHCRFEHRLVKTAQKALIPVPYNANVGAPGASPGADQPKGKGGGKHGGAGDRSGSSGTGKGRGKGGGKADRNGAPDWAPPVVCMAFHNSGTCRWGDDCFNLHADGMADVQRAMDARAAKDAAQAARASS